MSNLEMYSIDKAFQNSTAANKQYCLPNLHRYHFFEVIFLLFLECISQFEHSKNTFSCKICAKYI